MKITSKGQITIPIHIRKRFGLLPNTEVAFEESGGTVEVRKVRSATKTRPDLVTRLKGTATARMSTDEILARTRR